LVWKLPSTSLAAPSSSSLGEQRQIFDRNNRETFFPEGGE